MKKESNPFFEILDDKVRQAVAEVFNDPSIIKYLPKNLQNLEQVDFSELWNEQGVNIGRINELDYFYSNSISRSSKIMSECRKINQKIKKDGTNN